MEKHIKASRTIEFALVIGTLTAVLFSATLRAEDEYQHGVLFNPSQAVLEAERRGQIMIYDGLENKVVDKAMTEQFGRIENMMFVRVRHVDEDGEMIVEEDECD